MIEIIYNKEKEKITGNEEYFCVPRNIRQIGEVPKGIKIYLEDYVYTFLTADWKEEQPKGKIFILLGKCYWKQGCSYVFVKSAVAVDNLAVTKENCMLTDEQWGFVYEEMKTYFPGQEVVGWYLSLPDEDLTMTEGITKMHVKYFGGNDKVLFYADPTEREVSFFLYKNNHMEEQSGYYLFYEKNDAMQEYMLMRNPQEVMDYSGNVQDRAVKDFRKMITKRQLEKKERENGMSWGAVACMGVVALSLAAGAVWMSIQERGSSENDPASTRVSSIIEDEMIQLTPEAETSDEENSEVRDEMVMDDPIIEESPTVVPEDTITPTPEAVANSEEELETSVNIYTMYTVRDGDTLSKISMRYYGELEKVKEICKINNLLEEDVIYPGQTILLP